MQKLKIGLFGLGCVGQGLYDILTKTDHFDAEIVRICVKNKNKERPVAKEHITYDQNEILDDPNINLVIELIDNADEAFDIVCAAIKKGKNVVTANKKMLAENLSELIALQKKHDVSLLYEAAACASIPIIRSLEEYYDNEQLLSMEGIFNGSCNYILSKITNENLTYEKALSQAQELGFAETDPTLDVGGFDPKYKLCVLALHAYGIIVKPEEVLNLGIHNLSPFDIAFAEKNGFKIKAVGNSFKTKENEITMFVMPQFVDKENSLYSVENEYNAVLLNTAFSQAQTLIGKGAGGHPTGAAVLSDISALSYQYQYGFKKRSRNKQKMEYTTDVMVKVYIRSESQDIFEKLGFSNIEVDGRKEAQSHLIGSVSLNELISKKDLLEETKSFICFIGKK